MKKIRSERVRTIVGVARWNKMNYQRVYRAFTKGVIVAGADGRFDAKEAGTLIREAEANGKNGTTRTDVAAMVGGVDRSGLIEADQRYRRIRASIAEMEYLKARGELVVAKDVETALIQRELEFKDRMFAVPREVAAAISKMTPRQIESYLHAKITEAFKCLARPKEAAKYHAEFKQEASGIAKVG
ncbi:MAG: hypothetical protein ACREI9_08455 [Nitrospiraceae bacterium]